MSGSGILSSFSLRIGSGLAASQAFEVAREFLRAKFSLPSDPWQRWFVHRPNKRMDFNGRVRNAINKNWRAQSYRFGLRVYRGVGDHKWSFDQLKLLMMCAIIAHESGFLNAMLDRICRDLGPTVTPHVKHGPAAPRKELPAPKVKAVPVTPPVPVVAPTVNSMQFLVVTKEGSVILDRYDQANELAVKAQSHGTLRGVFVGEFKQLKLVTRTVTVLAGE